MSDSPTDTIGPWTIKAVATATRKAVIRAAEIEGVTVGQWLERHVAEWTQDGSPRPIAAAHVPHTLNRLSTDQTAPKLQHPLESLTLIACDFALRRNEMGERLAGAIERKLLAAIRALPTPPKPRQQPASLLPSRHEEPSPVNGEAT